MNAKDDDDKTPLLYACEKGLKEVALALLAKPDLDIHTVDTYSKQTPLSFALDKQFYSVLQAACAHPRFNAESISHVAVQKYYAKLDAFLGRYVLDSVPPVHRSATCLIRLARDTENDDASVVLKLMLNEDEFRREISTREHIGHSNVVIGIRGWHTPDGISVAGTAADGSLGQQPTPAVPLDEEHAELRYVLIMERGGQSLFIENVTQRIAGVNAASVATLFRATCAQVAALHGLGLVHGDIKLRNVIRRFGSDAVCLCDLDAGIQIGTKRSTDVKVSTAYAAPEVQASRRAKTPLEAHPSLDVWSLGVVLFELCTGRTLFAQDISNDDMVEVDDETRLATWSCTPDHTLEALFSDDAAQCTPEQKRDAQHLIRWLLCGDAARRPSLAEILAHRFLGGDAGPPSMRMIVHPSSIGTTGAPLEPIKALDSSRERFHVFVSHMQIEASGDVGTLFFLFEQMGLHGWCVSVCFLSLFPAARSLLTHFPHPPPASGAT